MVHSHVDIEQYRLTDPLDLRNDAFEVKCLCKHDFEDLLHVDGRGCRAKDQRRVHRFGEALGLLRDLLLLVARKSRKGIKLGADKKRDRSLRSSKFISQGKRGEK
jgi:hypothetical protein